MRKLAAALFAALMIAVPATAQNGNGRPTAENLSEHPALYGLCTAYFSGQGGEKGNKNNAPPFQALQDAAEAEEQSVEDFCRGVRPSNGKGQGSGNSNAPDPVDGR